MEAMRGPVGRSGGRGSRRVSERGKGAEQGPLEKKARAREVRGWARGSVCPCWEELPSQAASEF